MSARRHGEPVNVTAHAIDRWEERTGRGRADLWAAIERSTDVSALGPYLRLTGDVGALYDPASGCVIVTIRSDRHSAEPRLTVVSVWVPRRPGERRLLRRAAG